MKLLLTRELSHREDIPGIQCVVLPIFTYQALNLSSLPEFSQFSKVIFVSPRAVEFSQAWQSAFTAAHLYAIGPSTAEGLRAAGLKVSLPEIYSSEGVLALPEFQAIRGESILIVRGEGGRALLAEALEQRGAIVEYFEVYRRAFLPLAPKISGDAIWITSEMVLRHLAVHLPRQEILLLLASSRLAAVAKDLGFERIQVLRDATEAALRECLSS